MFSDLLKLPRARPFFSLLFAAVLVLAIARALLPDNIWADWAATHWLFSYQDGFIKRALVGEILRLFGIIPDQQLISWLYLAFVLPLAAVLAGIFLLPAARQNAGNGLLLFALLAVSSPATVQHYLYDSGRFDVFCLLLALLAFCLIHFCRTAVWQALAIFLCMGIAILIHEAAFFMFMPMVIGYWVFHDHGFKAIHVKILTFLALTALTWLVSVFGLLDASQLKADFADLQAQHGDWPVKASFNVLYFGSLAENLDRTLSLGFNLFRLLHHLLFFVLVLSPLLLLVLRFIRHHRATAGLDVPALFFIASAFAPLALYPLGHDHFRWWSVALCNAFIALSIIAWRNENFRQQLALLMHNNRYFIVFLVVVSLLVGPLGATDSFDWRFLFTG